MNKPPYPPCLEPGPRDADDDMGTSCMKWYGHTGPHDFVRNDWIVVNFKKAEEEDAI